MSEEYDVCKALDDVEEDYIEFLQTDIARGRKPNIPFYKAKLSTLRNHTNCQRSEEVEGWWKRLQRLQTKGGI